MKLSINPLIKGKIDKLLVPQIESLNAWTAIESSPEEIFDLITIDGYATTCELHGGNRKEYNYCTRQLFMVDVDGGMTIEELLADEFYNQYAAGFYATASFTPELHKFRILFITPEPIIAASTSRKIIRGLRKIYPQSDAACVDPARLFYGCINCEIKEWRGTIMPIDIIDCLVEVVDQEDRQREEELARRPVIEYTITDERREKILELLQGCFVGEYNQWRNIGWGLKAGGFTLADFQYVTTGMMRQKSDLDAANVWRDGGQVSKPVTMGSVIHFIKQRLGDDALKETRTTRYKDEYKLEKLARELLDEFKD